MHMRVIHVGAPNVIGKGKFVPCRGSNRGPRPLTCEANTLPRCYKSRLEPQGSTSALYAITCL